jgi:HK97 family phage portal protein
MSENKTLWQKIFGRAKGSDAAFVPTNMDERGLNDRFADIWQTQRSPSKAKLIEQYKAICYACANINAHRMASVKLRFYLKTRKGGPKPDFETKSLSRKQQIYLENREGQVGQIVKSANTQDIQEVVDHPAMKVLENCNPYMTFFELMEFTDLYQEFVGNAFWYLVRPNPLSPPTEIMVLPSQSVRTIRGWMGNPLISYYEFGQQKSRFETWEILSFKFPNLKDPYVEGWSPARAIWESIELMGKQSALSNIHMDNRGRPDILISPKDMMGPAEAKRLRLDFFKRFRRGGNGGVLVMENAFDIKNLAFTPKDLEMLAFYKVGKIEIANGYGVPLALLETEDVNRANAEAGHYQHAKLAIEPRCLRQEGRLSRFYCTMWDQSGDLFCAYDNCVPEDQVLKNEVRRTNLETGKNTINEIRREEHELPVPWGDKPWIQLNLAQPSEDESLNERPDLSAGHNPNGDNMDDKGGDGGKKPDPKKPDKKKQAEEARTTLITFYQGKLTAREAALELITQGIPREMVAKMLAIPKVAVTHQESLDPSSDGFWVESSLREMFKAQRNEVLVKLQENELWNAATSETHYQLTMRSALARYAGTDHQSEFVTRTADDLLKSANQTTVALLQDALMRVQAMNLDTLESTIETTKRVQVVFEDAINFRAKALSRQYAQKAIENSKLLSAK